MPRFAVEPTGLRSASSTVHSIDGQLASARAAVARLGSATGAAGVPALQGAIGAFAAAWAAQLEAIAASTDSLGSTLGASASAYETTDQTQIGP